VSSQLQIASATISRFHSFEVASVFERLGALRAIYSGLARPFLRFYSIAPDHIRTFPWIQTPLEAAQRLRLVPAWLEREAAWRAKQALDRHIARTLPDCHVYMAQSGIGLASGRAARGRGIVTVCDRSSAHIVHQDRLLRAEHERFGVPYAAVDPRVAEKEGAEYAEADAILVPSDFVRRSFLEMGVAAAKLHVVPFGVDVRAYVRSAPRDPGFRILFVGRLSLQKGLPYLLQAAGRARLSGATLVLTGPKDPETDVLLKRFPVPALEVTGPLDRPAVVAQMSRASVLVLPSIQDGFGMVMSQAMACGCPVIASANTGGDDLFADGEEGFIVPAGDADALADRLVRLRDDAALRDAMSEKALVRVRSVGGWDRYGRAALRIFTRLARAAGHDVVCPVGDGGSEG